MILAADYFDGRRAQPRAVRLALAEGELHIAGDNIALRVPVAEVQWPERQRHGPRIAHLSDGASLQSNDGPAWDAWARAGGLREPLAVKLQQSWRATLWAAAALVPLCLGAYLWGLPLAARGVLLLVPAELDQRLGESALATLRERGLLQPSTLPTARQQALRQAFAQALEPACAATACPAYTLHFHRGRFGANALALPGGAIVLTDEMVALLEGHDAAIVGVLAHEFGHLRERHGMRALVQLSLLGAATGVAFGDFSNLLAGVPVLLGQMAYSRDAEREADDEAIRVLRAAGIRPDVMLVLFERLAARNDGQHDGPAAALASHPADAERGQRFREAALH